jgi:hypothetical protein
MSQSRDRQLRAISGCEQLQHDSSRYRAVRYDLTWADLRHLIAQLCLARLPLFNHLVGGSEERGWHRKAERLGSFEIDD